MNENHVLENSLLDEVLRSIDDRKYLGRGAFGVVYKIGDYAVKIGLIEESEPIIQNWVCENFRVALPVLAYVEDVKLPYQVTWEACPAHTPWWNTPGSDENLSCHCGDSMSVMVMPLAENLEDKRKDSKWVSRIVNFVSNKVADEFGMVWDWRNPNIMKHKNRVVLIDFGNLDSEQAMNW